jgi:hypothetical protein
MFIFGFRAKMSFQRNFDKKARIKHLSFTKS